MKRSVLSLLLATILILAAFSVNIGEASAADPYKVEASAAKLAIDGSDEGYPKTGITAGKAVIKMAVWESTISVHVRMQGAGWISVAFNKQGKGMDGANMVLGYLDNSGKPAVRNDLGKGWTHKQAEKQDVLEGFVSQQSGETAFEFSYPLKFASGYGIAGLEKGGVYTLVVAGNERSNNISSKHTWYAKVDIGL